MIEGVFNLQNIARHVSCNLPTITQNLICREDSNVNSGIWRGCFLPGPGHDSYRTAYRIEKGVMVIATRHQTMISAEDNAYLLLLVPLLAVWTI